MSNDNNNNDQNQEFVNLPTSIGPYDIKEKINEGGYSKIYLGISKYTNDKVSIKIIDKSLFIANPDDLLLIKTEIDVLKILKHRNILILYEIYESSEYIFLVTEYLSSELINLIVKKKRLSEQDAVKIFVQLVDALLYMHTMGICHRDLRVEHVLFDDNNTPKIIDFGCSSFYQKERCLKESIGSLSYACPEIIQGNAYEPELADVWSLGVCLYVMLCGYLPFCEEDDEQNNNLIISGKIDFPKEIGNVCKDLLKKMLEVNPKKRLNFLKVSRHPWIKACQDVKIIGGYNFFEAIYPVDERLLTITEQYGLDQKKVEEELKLNKYNTNTGLFKVIAKKAKELKYGTISDFTSNLFIDYLKDKKNAKSDGETQYEEYVKNINKKNDIIMKNNIADYKKKENNVILKLEELKEKNDEEIENNQNEENKKKDETKIKKQNKDDNNILNTHTFFIKNRPSKVEKNNNIIQLFFEEFKSVENSISSPFNNKKKRKNSPKSGKIKLNLELIYKEDETLDDLLYQNNIEKIPPRRRSLHITLFRRSAGRLRKTSRSSIQYQSLMRKTLKNGEKDNIIHEIIENKNEDSKSDESDDNSKKLNKSEKSKSKKSDKKDKDQYSFSFEDEEGEEKSDNESEKDEKNSENNKSDIKVDNENNVNEGVNKKEETIIEKKVEDDNSENVKKEIRSFIFDTNNENIIENIIYYHDNNDSSNYIDLIEAKREEKYPTKIEYSISIVDKSSIDKEDKNEENLENINSVNSIENEKE